MKRKEIFDNSKYCPDSCESLYGGKCIMRVQVDIKPKEVVISTKDDTATIRESALKANENIANTKKEFTYMSLRFLMGLTYKNKANKIIAPILNNRCCASRKFCPGR